MADGRFSGNFKGCHPISCGVHDYVINANVSTSDREVYFGEVVHIRCIENSIIDSGL